VRLDVFIEKLLMNKRSPS